MMNDPTDDQREQHRRALYQAAVDVSRDAFKALILVNGGAAVAILALIGPLIEHKCEISQFSEVTASLSGSINYFIFGIAAALVGLGLAYLANSYFSATWAPNARKWYLNCC